jgi:hypothetical protein
MELTSLHVTTMPARPPSVREDSLRAGACQALGMAPVSKGRSSRCSSLRVAVRAGRWQGGGDACSLCRDCWRGLPFVGVAWAVN